MAIDHSSTHPLLTLDDSDLEFITRLILASGSLKDLAKAYGVSYPTIRTRLDRVIERLKLALKGRTIDPMDELLAGFVERGEMTVTAAKMIRDLHQKTRGT